MRQPCLFSGLVVPLKGLFIFIIQDGCDLQVQEFVQVLSFLIPVLYSYALNEYSTSNYKHLSHRAII